MDTDKHGFNKRKRRERRGEGKIMRGKIMGRIKNLRYLRFEISKGKICAK
jgi:hypothetical protein